jgi:hypothetical protein
MVTGQKTGPMYEKTHVKAAINLVNAAEAKQTGPSAL